MGARRRCASVLMLDEVVKVAWLVSHERVQQRTLLEILRFKSEVLTALFAERRHSIPHRWCGVIKAPQISSEDRMMPQQLSGLQCFGATDGKTVGGSVSVFASSSELLIGSFTGCGGTLGRLEGFPEGQSSTAFCGAGCHAFRCFTHGEIFVVLVTQTQGRIIRVHDVCAQIMNTHLQPEKSQVVRAEGESLLREYEEDEEGATNQKSQTQCQQSKRGDLR